ncbi:hypothetical protein ADICEAN_03744 [Cesiribacter andamanensis AMV16]|uniref:Uncharacterized protein n=1 Tax=Cesiribacter andamanensis AMV16 TaxID=1279009 RepID=M7N1F3_9BACT|nr:hypothetical protein ADICEAN_03744 [Cesiribacter andamanensis AMV16]
MRLGIGRRKELAHAGIGHRLIVCICFEQTAPLGCQALQALQQGPVGTYPLPTAPAPQGFYPQAQVGAGAPGQGVPLFQQSGHIGGKGGLPVGLALQQQVRQAGVGRQAQHLAAALGYFGALQCLQLLQQLAGGGHRPGRRGT